MLSISNYLCVSNLINLLKCQNQMLVLSFFAKIYKAYGFGSVSFFRDFKPNHTSCTLFRLLDNYKSWSHWPYPDITWKVMRSCQRNSLQYIWDAKKALCECISHNLPKWPFSDWRVVNCRDYSTFYQKYFSWNFLGLHLPFSKPNHISNSQPFFDGILNPAFHLCFFHVMNSHSTVYILFSFLLTVHTNSHSSSMSPFLRNVMSHRCVSPDDFLDKIFISVPWPLIK